jgi:hypothetical protein
MTTTYDDYRRALAQLSDLPSRIAADLNETQQTHVRAGALADGAVSAADARASAAMTAIQAQLAAARQALEPLGKQNLIPPRIRPSGGANTATRDDVLKAQQSLAAAVNQLRLAIQSEIERTRAESERLAREEAERNRLAREAAERASAAAARRRRQIQVGVAAALVLAVLIVIMAVSL